MKKSFPCWVCKGKGSWIEPVTDEGQGPVESCGYCEGQGMIEIGGKVHKRITAERIAMEIIKFTNPKRKLWSMKQLQALGNKALNLTK